MLSRSATRINRVYCQQSRFVSLAVNKKLVKHQKVSKYYDHDCRLGLVTNIFQCQTNGKEKTRKKTKNKEVYQKKRTKINKEIKTTKLYFHYNIILTNTESNRNISVILSKTTI